MFKRMKSSKSNKGNNITSNNSSSNTDAMSNTNSNANTTSTINTATTTTTTATTATAQTPVTSSTNTTSFTTNNSSRRNPMTRRQPPLAPEFLHVSQQQLLDQQQLQQQQHLLPPTASVLHRKQPSLSTYQTTPITKHYELNGQILSAFESHYNQKVYRIAYAIGMQFVETALLEIPKHGYFFSSRHERERMQSSLDAVRVTQLLQQMQQEQQDYIRPLPEDKIRVQKLAELALTQVQQASEDQYESQRAQAERELRGPLIVRIGSGSTRSALTSSNNTDSLGGAAAVVDAGAVVAANKQQQQKKYRHHTSSTSAEQQQLEEAKLEQALILEELQQRRRIAPIVAEPFASSPSSTCSSASSSSLADKPATRTQDKKYDKKKNSKARSDSLRMVQDPPLLVRSDPMTNSKNEMNDFDEDYYHHNPSRYSTYHQQQQQQQQQLSEVSYLNLFPANATTASSSTSTRTRTLDRMQSSEDLMLEKALYLSGLEVTPAVSMDLSERQHQPAQYRRDYEDDDNLLQRVQPPPPPSPMPKNDDNTITNSLLSDSFSRIMAMDWSNRNLSTADIQQQQQLQQQLQQQQRLQWTTVARFFHEDFDHLRKTGRVRVSFANTYQGRLPGSTNGCTVIAPLLCIHHLLNDECIPDPGLPDAVIEEVIDAETPSILSELRRKLGLSAQAFLIPSDAHDYLIENGQLSQEQFVTVTGGNILDESHLKAFVDALEGANRRKVAACFFFHEHVVAILKVRRDERGDIPCWYDLIDGLPLKETYAWVGETNRELSDRLQLTDSQEIEMDAFLPKTARIRCLNAEALIACLRWYACSKFNDDNVAYIDQYAWDDHSCDFDPRVFQGFVWASHV